MKNLKKLTLLHSNDLHGDFLAEQVDEKLVGGLSFLSGYIAKVREEEDNVLYAIAGDMFRGSVIDSEYKGLSTIELMNMISPDVVTLGNHETDYGVTHLLFIEKCAQFPIINANLHISTNGARLFKPYKRIRIGGMNILFIGILTEDVINQTKNDGLIGSLVNVEAAAKEVGVICNSHRSEDVDLTVLLTHIGYEEDQKLAALLDPAWGVDIIIGGHSHTVLDKPAVVNDILIVQAGTGTDYIGRFDLVVDKDTNSVVDYTWRMIPIDEEHCPKDVQLERVISNYKDETDRKYNRLVTHLEERLTHPTRYRETNLGDLFADILRETQGVDIFLLGSGSLRCEELGPIVTFGDLNSAFPYDGAIYRLKLSGAVFKRMILYMLRDEALQGEHTEFYQLSDGLEIEYSVKDHEFTKFNWQGAPMPDDLVLTVGLQDFHYKSAPLFFGVTEEEIAALEKPRKIATSCLEPIEEYLASHQRLYRENEGRLIINF